jgi:hypothetical protein
MEYVTGLGLLPRLDPGKDLFFTATFGSAQGTSESSIQQVPKGLSSEVMRPMREDLVAYRTRRCLHAWHITSNSPVLWRGF